MTRSRAPRIESQGSTITSTPNRSEECQTARITSRWIFTEPATPTTERSSAVRFHPLIISLFVHQELGARSHALSKPRRNPVRVGQICARSNILLRRNNPAREIHPSSIFGQVSVGIPHLIEWPTQRKDRIVRHPINIHATGSIHLHDGRDKKDVEFLLSTLVRETLQEGNHGR